jgi:isovaleryl-CoA dehydrogenase
MNFELTEEQNIFKDYVYRWAMEKYDPMMEEVDEKDFTPPGLFPAMGEMGLLGVTVDPQYGGSGQPILTEVIATEQLSRVSPAFALSMVAHCNLCAGNISLNANEEQKSKYLPGLVSGEKIGALGITEPGAGSDAMGMTTRAVADGDHYVINGTKTFITNGDVADVVMVYTKTAPELGPQGISAFIVEKGTPGFTASKKIKKVGMRGSSTAELVFDNCRVPAGNMVGKLNRGVEVVTRGLDLERTVVAGISLGAAHRALEESIKYCQDRKQFGKPIGRFQMMQAKLAEMYARLEAARSMVYRAAALAEKSERGGKGTELTKLAAAAILLAGETGTWVCNEAVQIHGGYGYCSEFPVQRLWRDAKLIEIGAGTTEIRKMIIARELLNTGRI